MAKLSAEESFSELDDISRRHYELSLANLLQQIDTPLGRKRYARLLGVLVKQPFSEEFARAPSNSTQSVIGLDWKQEDAIRQTARDNWQFEFVRELSASEGFDRLSDEETFSKLTYYRYESMLGRAILQAFRDRICGDPQTSAALKKALAEARKAGVNLIEPTTAKLSIGVATTAMVALGSLLPPALATVAGPVIGGIALLLVQVGVDGFCNWSYAALQDAERIENEDRKSS